MKTRTGMLTAGLSIVLAAAVAAAPAMAQTPKKGGTLTYMIPADAPPSFDGHREETYATVHSVSPAAVMGSSPSARPERDWHRAAARFRRHRPAPEPDNRRPARH